VNVNYQVRIPVSQLMHMYVWF